MMVNFSKKLSAFTMVLSCVIVMTGCNGKQQTSSSQQVKNIENMPKVSVQLWSVKNEVKADFKGTLQALSAMGFEGVEFANEFGEYTGDAFKIKQVMDSTGLTGSGAHVSFEQLNEDNFADTVVFYQTLGVDTLVIGWDERTWHPEGVKEVVRLLNYYAEKLAPHNMKMGYHNHEHEFNSYESATYWDYVATHTTRNVVLQQDVGWTTYAGKDPIDYVKRYPGRTLTTHYKVKLPKGSEGKLPIIGQDTIDWLNLTKTNIAVGGTKWLVVEQEEYPNGLTPMQAVEKSKQGLDKVLAQL